MMKKFITSVLGSFVGASLALTVFSITSLLMCIAMATVFSGESSPKVKENSILYLDLGMSITERSEQPELMSLLMNPSQSATVGLDDILKSIENAKTNKDVKGIYIECNGVSAGISTLMAIRESLESFKKEGGDKFIYAYGNSISQADYLLASVADSIYLNPVGELDIHGLASQSMYFKKLMDKVGVEMQIIRVGKFKSAVEPYMLEQMSEANRLQQEHYLGSIWGTISEKMAKSRGIDKARLNAMADSMLMAKPVEYLVENKLVDRMVYKTEMDDILRGLTNIDKEEKLRLVSPALLAEAEDESEDDKIAVLYAEGEIDGSEYSGIVSEKVVEALRDIINDEDVKGLVLRVNSPGGSAFGSEQIWKALEDFKATGRPFAVSMGDLAASGGYYISCGADRIFAYPTTITGSIGIFGMIPCAEELVTNKVGVNVFTVATNQNAGISALQKMTPYQADAMQQMVNRGYELFTKRCADGRHMEQDSIKAIAEGRVWDGATALEIGLVDELGNLDAAIAWVAKKADLKEYSRKAYPEQKSQWEQMLEEYMEDQYEAKLRAELGTLYDFHKEAQRIMNRKPLQCLMEPVIIK